MLGQLAKEEGDLAGAARHFSAAVAADPNFVPALSQLAMIYAAAPDAALRNGPQALVLGRRALRLTRSSDLQAVAAAAAASAGVGEFHPGEAPASAALVWAAPRGWGNETAQAP